MSTLMEKTRKTMLRKFHALCATMGIHESDKRAMIESYGVTSSRDLTAIQLIELIDCIKKVDKLKDEKKNQKRRQVMSSIYELGKAIGTPYTEAQVMAIMCQGGKVDHINDIPYDTLRAMYASFLKQRKMHIFAGNVAAEEIAYKQSVN